MTIPDNPFVGLRPFESEDSLYYFGRNEQTKTLLRQLHQHRFVAVVGSSGSGKSSLIRAGLVPQLEAGFLVQDRDQWCVARLKPGDAPLGNLVESLRNLEHLHPPAPSPSQGEGEQNGQVSVLVDAIREQGTQAIVDMLEPLLRGTDTNLFILVDQFEELFRFGVGKEKSKADRQEAEEFVALLLSLTRHELPVYVCLTMRSEFLGDCDAFYSLPEAINQSQFLVPRLTRKQRQEVITHPVHLTGSKITQRLVDRLLNEGIDTRDDLPVLQHVLMRTWDVWQESRNTNEDLLLDVEHYEAADEIHYALNSHADETLDELNERQQSIARRLFQALTAVDAGNRRIRRPVKLNEVAAIAEAAPEEVMEVIDCFRKDGRAFLVLSSEDGSNDPLIDISHESLIRQWETLKAWVDNELEAAKTYIRLVDSEELYSRGDGSLLRGAELAWALKWKSEIPTTDAGQIWAKRYHDKFDIAVAFLAQSKSVEDKHKEKEQYIRDSKWLSQISALEHRSLQIKVSQLINSFRYLGHLAADTNPLGDYSNRFAIPQLMLEHHGLSDIDQDITFNPGSFNMTAEPTLGNIYHALKETYGRTIGFEYMHITDVQEKRWIQECIELGMARNDMTSSQQLTLLKHLTAAEGFEQFLHLRYVGQKRFGLEGGESLIPVLHTLIQEGGRDGLQEAVIGMTHRGRLNVLANIMNKPPTMIFDEFEGNTEGEFTGDVNYHNGYSNDVITLGGTVHLALAFSPSHLEIVSPVVEGSVRARQERRIDKTGKEAMGIIIHGDAAFAGQGVVMETFSMAQTRGYRTRGTIHIVINNQVGFTTSTAADSRSTHYPTDIAKMLHAPIIHINGDDPEAAVYVSKLALNYRNFFQKDIVIDLVCYRRLGHNSTDEPYMTQPIMYKFIRSLTTTRTQYAEKLVAEGVLSQEDSDGLVREYRGLMEQGEVVDTFLNNERTEQIMPGEFQTHWGTYIEGKWWKQVDTTVSGQRIQTLSKNWLTTIPEDFEVHHRVKAVIVERVEMGRGERSVDWGFGETLAYATLLEEGYNVRLSGQDCGRGTFSHRHAVLHNQQRREQWVPLRHGMDTVAEFTVIDSLLSKEAILAFEYGFSATDPETLVIWEAQLGDFVNGAQIVIDQFISTSEQKWQRLCGLVMFLPHGLEGQGPDNSSGQLERFIIMAAQENIQVCVPTTPAQLFHMLRRQMIRPYRKPLIVFTPKTPHPLSKSEIIDFTDGKFEYVLDDEDFNTTEKKSTVKRLVICSGKVYFDLLTTRRKLEIKNTALIRLEQLYPFPDNDILKIVEQYPNAEEKIWCQEEPSNQGAWYGISPHFKAHCNFHDLQCISRPASATSAVGSPRIHRFQQQELVSKAFNLTDDVKV